MHCIRALVLVALAVFTSALPARAALPAHVDLRGKEVGLYLLADGPMVAANGTATVRLGAQTVTADSIRYDLRHNRMLAAGHVEVDGPHALACAAYALDVVTGDAWVLRLEPMAATYLLRGAAADATPSSVPAGTFDAADLAGAKPYMRTRHAVVAPNVSVRLTPAEVTGGTGTAIVTPTYLYVFANNPNFATSALPPATADQPYPLFGTANSLLVGHVRYDQQDGAGIALDEHLVDGQHAYLDASAIPIRGRQIDVAAFDQLAPGVQQRFSGDATLGPYAYAFGDYALQWSTVATIATLETEQFGADRLLQTTLSSQTHALGHLLSYQVRGGYGYDRDPGALPFQDDFRIFGGGFVTTPTVRGPLGIDLSSRYQYAWTHYDFPHQTSDGDLSFTLSRTMLRPRLLFNAFASFEQVDDRYRNDAAFYLGLPNPALPYLTPDGTPYPGYFAYAGLSTYRTYTISMTAQAQHSDDRLQASLTRTDDFPQFAGFGRPPLSLFVDVTHRFGSTLKVEFGRGYAFGWGGTWVTPQYVLAVSP